MTEPGLGVRGRKPLVPSRMPLPSGGCRPARARGPSMPPSTPGLPPPVDRLRCPRPRKQPPSSPDPGPGCPPALLSPLFPTCFWRRRSGRGVPANTCFSFPSSPTNTRGSRCLLPPAQRRLLGPLCAPGAPAPRTRRPSSPAPYSLSSSDRRRLQNQRAERTESQPPVF